MVMYTRLICMRGSPFDVLEIARSGRSSEDNCHQIPALELRACMRIFTSLCVYMYVTYVSIHEAMFKCVVGVYTNI